MIDLANAAVEAKSARPLYPLQDDLRAALRTPSDFTLHRSVSDVPDSVRTAFAKAAQEETFSMADPGGDWEATDVIQDLRRPRRRLSTVAINGAFCLVFYEHGGIVRTNNVAAFRMSYRTAEPVWHAYLEPSAPLWPAPSIPTPDRLEVTFNRFLRSRLGVGDGGIQPRTSRDHRERLNDPVTLGFS
jgi:hypothetical protein